MQIIFGVFADTGKGLVSLRGYQRAKWARRPETKLQLPSMIAKAKASEGLHNVAQERAAETSLVGPDEMFASAVPEFAGLLVVAEMPPEQLNFDAILKKENQHSSLEQPPMVEPQDHRQNTTNWLQGVSSPGAGAEPAMVATSEGGVRNQPELLTQRISPKSFGIQTGSTGNAATLELPDTSGTSELRVPEELGREPDFENAKISSAEPVSAEGRIPPERSRRASPVHPLNLPLANTIPTGQSLHNLQKTPINGGDEPNQPAEKNQRRPNHELAPVAVETFVESRMWSPRDEAKKGNEASNVVAGGATTADWEAKQAGRISIDKKQDGNANLTPSQTVDDGVADQSTPRGPSDAPTWHHEKPDEIPRSRIRPEEPRKSDAYQILSRERALLPDPSINQNFADSGETEDWHVNSLRWVERDTIPDIPTVSRHGAAARDLNVGFDFVRASPRIVGAQVIQSISRMSQDGAIEIRLQPEELGRLRVSLTPTDTGVAVQINAERVETLDLVRRNIEALEKDLVGRGFENPTFSFGSEGANRDSQFHQQSEADAVVATATELRDAPTTMTGHPTFVSDGRIDIRV